MKLRTGQARYRIPAHSCIEHVIVEGKRHNQIVSYRLQQVEMVRLKELPDIRGFPAYFAVWDETIEFYPAPNKPYSVKVRYTPPMQEF